MTIIKVAHISFSHKSHTLLKITQCRYRHLEGINHCIKTRWKSCHDVMINRCVWGVWVKLIRGIKSIREKEKKKKDTIYPVNISWIRSIIFLQYVEFWGAPPPLGALQEALSSCLLRHWTRSGNVCFFIVVEFVWQTKTHEGGHTHSLCLLTFRGCVGARMRWTSISRLCPSPSRASTENVCPRADTDTDLTDTISPSLYTVKLGSDTDNSTGPSPQSARFTEKPRESGRKKERNVNECGGRKSKIEVVNKDIISHVYLLWCVVRPRLFVAHVCKETAGENRTPLRTGAEETVGKIVLVE